MTSPQIFRGHLVLKSFLYLCAGSTLTLITYQIIFARRHLGLFPSQERRMLTSAESLSVLGLLTTRKHIDNINHNVNWIRFEELKVPRWGESGALEITQEKNDSSGEDGEIVLPRDSSLRSPKNPLDSKKLYLVRNFCGRLGNVMFQFASALCIALNNNLTLLLQHPKDMTYFRPTYKMFEVRDKVSDQLKNRVVKGHRERACCSFDEKLQELMPRGYSHRLSGYTQSWKYFEPCKEEIKKAFLFKEDIVVQATDIVSGLRKRFLLKVLVGVHIRVEDYTRSHIIQNGKAMAPPAYFIRAMTYFREAFHDVIFVVITSKVTWFKTQVTNSSSDVIVLNRSSSPAVDMEVLSLMDHLIISVGTFGWWAAYRNKGVIVCYKDFFRPGSPYGKQIWNNATDFFYPGWILL